MGRKSLAEERIEQILDAFEACIVEYGFAGASLQRIADRAGVQVSIINHYIGNRQALVTAMIDRFAAAFAQDAATFRETLPDEDRLNAFLDAYFSDSAIFYRPDSVRIFIELTPLSARDPGVMAQLTRINEAAAAGFRDEVDRALPHLDEASRHTLAHQLYSLWIGHRQLRWMGVQAASNKWARAAAQAIVNRGGRLSSQTTAQV